MKSLSFCNLFETMVINDFLKRFLHFGQMPSMYYMRTRDGLEIDLLLEVNQFIHLFEIKSAITINTRHASSLIRMLNKQKEQVKTAAVISRARENYFLTKGITSYNWKNILGS